VGGFVLIQITPQLRILVAIEAIDGRKGMDSLAQLCREKLAADPFSGCLFIFRSRSGRATSVGRCSALQLQRTIRIQSKWRRAGVGN
jgi:transposase